LQSAFTDITFAFAYKLPALQRLWITPFHVGKSQRTVILRVLQTSLGDAALLTCLLICTQEPFIDVLLRLILYKSYATLQSDQITLLLRTFQVNIFTGIDPCNSSDTKQNACYFSLQHSYILS